MKYKYQDHVEDFGPIIWEFKRRYIVKFIVREWHIALQTKRINMHKAHKAVPLDGQLRQLLLRKCSLRALHCNPCWGRVNKISDHCTTLCDYLNKGTNVSVNLDRLLFLFSPYNTYRLCPSVINNNISQLKKQKKYERTFKDPRICLNLPFHRKATCH